MKTGNCLLVIIQNNFMITFIKVILFYISSDKHITSIIYYNETSIEHFLSDYDT